MNPPYLDAAAVRARVPPLSAVRAIEEALRQGLDPEADPARDVVEVPHGQLLLMPAAGGRWAGVKVASVAPANPARGLPRIQAVYLLLDGEALAPVALLDGTELTAIRTPAVSAVAVDHLAEPGAARLVVFGAGPQAWGHVEALRAVRPLSEVRVVARNAVRADELVRRCRAAGLDAAAGDPDDVRRADIVACCTTAAEPLFAGRDLADHACVVAVGSHEPKVREVDTETVRRSTVVVESRSAALREAGDLLVPIHAGELPASVVAGNLSELVLGQVWVDPGRPRFFKSVGMAWEDLVVAAAAYDQRDLGR